MKVYVNTAELDMKRINDFIDRNELEKWIIGNNRIMVIIDDLPTFEAFTKIAGKADFSYNGRMSYFALEDKFLNPSFNISYIYYLCKRLRRGKVYLNYTPRRSL